VLSYVSPQSLQILGYTPDEMMIEWTRLATDNPINKKGIELTLKALKTGKKQGIYLLELYKKDRSKVLFEIDESPLKDEQGNVIGIVGAARDVTGRIMAEEERDRILNLSYDLICIEGADGYFKYVNPAWESTLGYSREELLSMHFLDIVHPDEYHKNKEDFFALLASGKQNIGYENCLIHKDGSTRIISWTASPLPEKGLIYCIGRNITERKKAEASLKDRETFLHLQFNRMPIGCITWDVNFRVLSWNPAAGKIFGFTEEEATGKHPYDIIVPKDEQLHVDTIWQRLLEGDITAHSENENITKDGHTVTCYWVNTPFRKANGEVIGVISMVQDITERKKAEEALQASEAELHDNYFTQAAINMILSESLENIPLEEFLQKALNMILSIPWIAFEAIGSISLVEDGADALMMKAQSNIPKPLKELCLRVPFGKCLCGKAAQAQKIQFADHIDERHEICYEGIVPHGHYSVPILSGGRTLGVLNIYLKEGHIRNQKEEEFLNTVANTLAGIIARRKAEKEQEKLHDQLLQAQKMEAVGQLSGGIAHDFNNILTAIIGYGNLLKMEVEKDSRLSTYVKNILDSAGRAANLTHDLLAFSRKQMISPKPINVNEVIKGAEKILLRLIGADIELSTHLSDKDLTVMADSTQMEHVLMNLATNARDAMPEVGNLLISSDFTEIDERFINIYGYGEKGKYAVMTVSDTGVGIDEQTKDKIFEPFFTTKEVGKGTGLGLAMVYGIVKQHDGFINVYSEQGKGTTFKIYLPLIHAEITDTKEIELPISKGGIETILVAEDDAMVRKFMREVLEGAGYTVIEAKDGEDAIDVFIENKDRIQLLILDVIMPKKNGKEVYETLKESNPYIKALFISGYSADILHKKGIISEGPEVILKPISSDNLLRKIRDLLDQ
jgi:PAS domain S-box-containing protein